MQIADSGYWYVVENVGDPDFGGLHPGNIPGPGWWAWYATLDGITYALVRTPEEVNMGAREIKTPNIIARMLQAMDMTDFPFARVGGS